jgi:hypothetical protein
MDGRPGPAGAEPELGAGPVDADGDGWGSPLPAEYGALRPGRPAARRPAASPWRRGATGPTPALLGAAGPVVDFPAGAPPVEPSPASEGVSLRSHPGGPGSRGWPPARPGPPWAAPGPGPGAGAAGPDPAAGPGWAAGPDPAAGPGWAVGLDRVAGLDATAGPLAGLEVADAGLGPGPEAPDVGLGPGPELADAGLGPVPAAGPPRLGHARRGARVRPARARTQATVRHLDVFTVLRVSVLFYLVVALALVTASVLLWVFADAFGSLPSIEKSVRTLFSLKTFVLHPSTVAFWTGAVGVVLSIAGTLVNVLAAVTYNLIADVVGGVRVELEAFQRD